MLLHSASWTSPFELGALCLASDGPSLTADANLAELVRGGNPKMCYANYRLKARWEFLDRPMRRDEVCAHL